ncbi:MAG: hypothetical protein QOF49_1179 [Chloroflexota bacterium]|nr:hypothetical protein [Chloroflexota bacterium]
MGDDRTAESAKPDRSVPARIDEPVIDAVTGIGGVLYVTATSVVIVRDDAQLRPRSGVRRWPHAALDVRLERPRNGTGRVVLWPGRRPQSAVSLFVAAPDWPSAESVAGQIRSHASRARNAAGLAARGPVPPLRHS